MRRLTYAQAVQEALDQAMERDPAVYVIGEGVPDPKGIFGTTAGIPERILDFAKWDKQVRLAWSLNAPNDAIRSAIMPINEKYPIQTVLKAFQKYCHSTGRRITVEYVLLKGINDSVAQLDELVILAKKVDCNINLIVYNSTPGTPFHPPTEKEVDAIFQYLQGKDILVTLRKSRGQDISAACGQLAQEKQQLSKPD